MKKIIALLLLAALVLSLCACKEASSSGETKTAENVQENLTPAEKLDAYFTQNGTQDGFNSILNCPEIADKFKDHDYTVAAMTVGKEQMSSQTEFKLVKTADGIRIELLDTALGSAGLKLERSITIEPDGSYKYSNGIQMAGNTIGVQLSGKIDMGTHTKDTVPAITDSTFSEGASLTDAVKNTLRDYVNLALESYSEALSADGLNLTLSDVGYTSYQ